MSRQSASSPAGPRSRGTGGRSSSPARGGKPRSAWRWLRRLLWLTVALGTLGLLGIGIAYATIKLPTPNEVATAQGSIVYYADGTTEMKRISEINRESVALGDLPVHVGQSMLAAEDRGFYQENGVSPKGMARAVWVAIKGGAATQGGSTITQQYVKNTFLTSDRTITRKFKEILLSIKIDQQQSKSQILENYLNTIYYGRGAYGIQTAAQAYYGKQAKDLTIEESAVLASIIRAPSLYDPQLGAQQEKNVQERFPYVLDGMVTQGWLDSSKRATMTYPAPKAWKPSQTSGPNGYLVQLVKKELKDKLKLTEADIDRGGLKIISTIEKPRQDAAVAAVQEYLPTATPALKAGLASVKPGDGAIVALYGGADYAKEQFNSATDATMQAGSTFKPITLLAALQSGKVSLKNTFDESGPQYFPEFRDATAPTEAQRNGAVNNFGGESFGYLDVPGATANSVNTIYAQLNILATPKATSEMAAALGVKSKVEANYGNVFGTSSVRVLEMANAYATIAAGGLRADPYIVKSAKSADGTFDFSAKPETTRVVEADLVADATAAMQAVVDYGSGAKAQQINRPAAGKTGTTSDNKAAWFNAFVPQLATAVGLYWPGPTGQELEMKDIGGLSEITGGSFPATIWTAYMRAALQGVDVAEFPEPAYVNKDVAPALPSTAPSSSAPVTPPATSAPKPTPGGSSSSPSPVTTSPSPTTTGGSHTPTPSSSGTPSTPPPTSSSSKPSTSP